MQLQNQELEKLIISLTAENFNLKQQLEKQERGNILFSDYIYYWLSNHKYKVKHNSFLCYKSIIDNHIAPYFKKAKIQINQIKPFTLEEYYKSKLSDNLSASTISRHHSLIHSTLKYAVKNDIIISNPSDYADKPKTNKYMANYISADEINRLINAFKNHRMFIPILLAATLGLRRSEVLGLKWNAIDFKKGTIHVKHTVVKILQNNQYSLQFSDITKNTSSNRILPLPQNLLVTLKNIKQQQLQNYINYGKEYSKEYLGYVCVDNKGVLFTPDNLSNRFAVVVKNTGLNIRFHDLRHSCASILADCGMEMKDISEWLWHSDINVTSDIYVHLFYDKKIKIS